MVAAALTGSLCGLSGLLITRLGLTTICFTIAHAALAGATLGLVLSIEPIAVALVFAIVIAALLSVLMTMLRVPVDLISMSFFSLYTALALLFIYLTPGTAMATQVLSTVLWGSVLAMTYEYITYIAILLIAYITYLVLYMDRVLMVLFDLKLAEAEGLDTRSVLMTLLLLSSFVISVSLKLTGGFLVFTIFYGPALATLNLNVRSVRKMLATSPLIGAMCSIAGVIVSYVLDLPVGCCIVLSMCTVVAATSLRRLIEVVRKAAPMITRFR
ncbi:MAG: hypothetical protein DRJ40_03695 [Thermoprotei archaeon]|nr:MAG: hypothetical protein DRJ40_03695 [Thermoprotei archaeon]